jgi:zinc transporter 2
VGVFLVSIVIYFKPGWVWFDPLCTVLFSIIVFFTTVPVSQECIRVLMEASPEKVDTEHLRSQIEEIKGVLGVYELRIWNVNETKSVLSAKVLVDKHSSTVMSRVKAICKSYKIYSSTIELQVFKH